MTLGMAVGMVIALLARPLLESIETAVPTMVAGMIAGFAACGAPALIGEPGAAMILTLGSAAGVLLSLAFLTFGRACRRRLEQRVWPGTERP